MGVDLYIISELRTLTDVYMGDRDLGTATKSGNIKVIGDSQLERRFGKWFPLSTASAIPRVSA